MSPVKRRSTPKKPTASTSKAQSRKKPTKRAARRPKAAKPKAKAVLKPKSRAPKARPARGVPRSRRAHKLRSHALRQPVPNVEPRGREKPKLRELSHAQRRAVDALLLRVYQQAARELASLEADTPANLSPDDAARLEATNRAREELMAALRAWEARQKLNPQVPPEK